MKSKQVKLFKSPTYDFSQHSRSNKTREIVGGDHAIIVLEGILLFADLALRELMDIRIFMDTPLDVCLIRRARRDIKERGREIRQNIFGSIHANCSTHVFSIYRTFQGSC